MVLSSELVRVAQTTTINLLPNPAQRAAHNCLHEASITVDLLTADQICSSDPTLLRQALSLVDGSVRDC